MGNSVTGTLYIAATPIGNLEDITYRAVEILKSVDLIAAEDTRTTGILLSKYDIDTKLTSYHKFNEKEKTSALIKNLLEGKNIALVSDAGTPLISDPGNILVFEAEQNGIKIVPIGGISAITTFLSATSRKGESFKFIGFMPRVQKQIEDIIKKNLEENLVFYESPERIKATLELIYRLFPNSKITLGRELTKKFEEIKTDSIKNILEYYSKNPIKGEIVCMLHGAQTPQTEDYALLDKIKQLKIKGFKTKEIAQILEVTDNACKNKVKELCFLIL